MKPLLLNLRWKVEPWTASWRLPLLQAHRGYWVENNQENSLEAFAQAYDKGYKMSELDVRLSLDHVPVVFHDKDLRRWGRPEVLVREISANTLRELTGAPSLSEVLLSGRRPEILNIELKSENGMESFLEKKVADLTSKYSGPILFSSFNPYSIWFLSQLVPQHPRALLSSFAQEEGNHFLLRHLLAAPLVRAHMLNLDHRYVDAGTLQHFSRRGIPVALWTVNDKEQARELLEAGAVSIITDSILPS